MTNAIVTKYIAPTDSTGAMVRAFSPRFPTVRIPWNYTLDAAENHQAAAAKLARNLGFKGVLVGAWKGDKMVWVDKATVFRIILI